MPVDRNTLENVLKLKPGGTFSADGKSFKINDDWSYTEFTPAPYSGPPISGKDSFTGKLGTTSGGVSSVNHYVNGQIVDAAAYQAHIGANPGVSPIVGPEANRIGSLPPVKAPPAPIGGLPAPALPGGTSPVGASPVVNLPPAPIGQPANPMPANNPFTFTPSRPVNEALARTTAGQRAAMQIDPQIRSKEQQRALAAQGLQMMLQKLQQGAEQSAANTMKEVPTMTDQARRTLSSAGLSESGFVPAAQTNIQGRALSDIQQANDRARLSGEQATLQVGQETRGIDAEIAGLRGLYSAGPNGPQGTLVDSLQQDILDKNADFTMRERQNEFSINQATNQLNLARYQAQEAVRQGDNAQALQARQMEQQAQQQLAQLNFQREQLSEQRRQFDQRSSFDQTQADRNFAVQEGQLTGHYLPQGAQTLITDIIGAKKAFGSDPQANAKATAARQSLSLQYGIDANGLFGANVSLEQAIGNINQAGILPQQKAQLLAMKRAETEAAMSDLQLQLAQDPNSGAAAQARVGMQKAQKDLQLIDAEIRSANALANQRNTPAPSTVHPVDITPQYIQQRYGITPAALGQTTNYAAFTKNLDDIAYQTQASGATYAHVQAWVTANQQSLAQNGVDPNAFLAAVRSRFFPNGTGTVGMGDLRLIEGAQ